MATSYKMQVMGFWNRFRIIIVFGILILLAFLLYYYGMPAAKNAIAPDQPVEVIQQAPAPTWYEVLPPPPKKQSFTIPVIAPPKILGTDESKQTQRSKK